MADSLIQSIVLGVIQGLGEFLPISSTAHLVLVPYFFHWPDPGLSFDVALHFGTLIAVVSYFWKDWMIISKLPFQNKNQNAKIKMQNYGNNLLYFIAIATIPGVLAGYFLESEAETAFRNPILIALMLALGGLFLYLADKFGKRRKKMNNLSWKDAVIIGFFQAMAIIPGISRSGATITAGLWKGLERKEAAKFSFLLSTPIIFGAVALKFPDIFHSGINTAFVLGTLFSAVSGYIAIKYLIKFIEKVGYGVFFGYRLLIALLILIIAWIF